VLEERLLEIAIPKAPALRRASKSAATSAGAMSLSSWMQMLRSASGFGSAGVRLSITMDITFLRSTFSSRISRACCRSSCSSSGHRVRARSRHPADDRLRDDKRLAIGLVELDGDVACHLEVLPLVLATGTEFVS